MNRSIRREYFFSDREVNEALIAWLKSKDFQTPEYVGDTPCTCWCKEADGIRVIWTVDDQPDL